MRKNKKNILNLILLIIFTMFLSPNINAIEENINDYDYLKLEINNQIKFQISTQKDWDIKNFEITSYFFPQSFNNTQYLNSFETSSKNYRIINESGNYYLQFFYDKNSLSQNNEINNKFIIESTPQISKITKKVKYPLTNLSKEYKQYLEFGNLINIDENIKNQASSLASGEDDTFIIASEIAQWIKEYITYNLTTVTENPNQTSTEVFKSKSGVCKEISNLYISMLRSIGIPARVITGYAYTNSEELVQYLESYWGAHAWVEVLIGEEWVPFDLTYNQYAYVDASHIIFDKSSHIKSNNLVINTTGYGYQFVGQSSTNNDFTIINKIKSLKNDDEGYVVQLEGPDKLGFGSYGYIKAKIENGDNYYKILFLRLSKIDKIENIDASEKMIVFNPYEQKDVYFRYKITNDLHPDYQYTLPFAIYGDNFEMKYDVIVKEEYLSMKKIALPEDKEENATLSNNSLIFKCNYILNASQNTILCSVKNPNNYEIDNLNVCLKNNCQKIDLKLNEEKSLSFYTANFNETIIYSCATHNGIIELYFQKPELFTNYYVEGNALNINYSIENFYEGLTLNLYINGKFIQSSNVENAKISLPLENGENTINIELRHSATVFDKKEYLINHTLTSDDNNKSSKNFFQKLKDFIIYIFDIIF